MRTGLFVAAALVLAPVAAHADARGQALYGRHCARCHVVGQGAPPAQKSKSLVDITLAARGHDRAWLIAFLQKPYAVDPDSECHAALDRDGARLVYRFLRARLRPARPAAGAKTASSKTASSSRTPAAHVAAAPARVPSALPMRVVPPPAPPKPQGLVRR